MRRPPTHPGEMLLKEFIEPLGHGAQIAAARAMGISRNQLNEICAGKRPVSARIAVLIGAVTGTSAEMWARLQSDYDVWRAIREVDVSAITPIAKTFERVGSSHEAHTRPGQPVSQRSRQRSRRALR